MWSTSSRDFSRCHFMEIRVTQCSRDIHKRSSLVPNFKIVMLNCVKHAVPSCRCVAETPVKNSLQGLVVNFNMDNITPKNVLCQFLASKHNGEDLFLNLANIISVWVKALNAKLAGCCNWRRVAPNPVSEASYWRMTSSFKLLLRKTVLVWWPF